jgi:hypothetical protein
VALRKKALCNNLEILESQIQLEELLDFRLIATFTPGGVLFAVNIVDWRSRMLHSLGQGIVVIELVPML